MNIIDQIRTYFFKHNANLITESALSNAAHNAASGVRPAMVSFQPLERVADSDIVGELSTIRARSRDIIRNSSIGAGIIKLMCRGVIGDGLKLMPAINGAVLGLSRDE